MKIAFYVIYLKCIHDKNLKFQYICYIIIALEWLLLFLYENKKFIFILLIKSSLNVAIIIMLS